MKTINRQLFFGAILAMALAAGSVAVTAQTPDPCEAATAAYGEWTKLFELKDMPSRKATIDKGKDFVSKYSNCEATKDGAKFISDNLPVLEENYKKREKAIAEAALLKRFNDALAAKNWDEVYSSGKEALALNADKYRAAELVLGSIGLDETTKTPTNTKWNDETIKFAKQSIADIEAGKKFDIWGVGTYTYKGKEDALGWMNYTIGYLLFNDKKDKKAAAEYMYKVSQIPSDKKSEPVVYSVIASYYVIDLNKNIEELKALPGPADADTPEVKQQKIDAIKDKTAMVNGAAERVMDAYARAYKLAPDSSKAYKDGLKASFKQIYDLRYQKPDSSTPTVDAWINMAVAKPLVNPATPVTPVMDTEKTATLGTTPGTTTTVKPSIPSAVKPGTPVTTKPAGSTTPVKPAGPQTKPSTAGVKPAVAAVKKKTTK